MPRLIWAAYAPATVTVTARSASALGRQPRLCLLLANISGRPKGYLAVLLAACRYGYHDWCNRVSADGERCECPCEHEKVKA